MPRSPTSLTPSASIGLLFSRTLRLTMLAPDTVEAVLNGTQPPTLRLTDIERRFRSRGRSSAGNSVSCHVLWKARTSPDRKRRSKCVGAIPQRFRTIAYCRPINDFPAKLRLLRLGAFQDGQKFGQSTPWRATTAQSYGIVRLLTRKVCDMTSRRVKKTDRPGAIRPPLDDSSAGDLPVARDTAPAPRAAEPPPEGTAGRCPCLGGSARRGNVRRIRGAPAATTARRTGSPWTGTPP